MSALEENIRPQFELTPNYLEIIYRQYVIFIGMVASPLVSLLAVVATAVEYVLDKATLTRIAKKPPRSVESNRSLVTVFAFAVAIAAMINIGSGNIY
jgi:TMC domain